MRSAGKTAAFIYVLAREEGRTTGPGGKQWGRGEDGGGGVRRAAERQESIPSEGPRIGAVECKMRHSEQCEGCGRNTTHQFALDVQLKETFEVGGWGRGRGVQ